MVRPVRRLGHRSRGRHDVPVEVNPKVTGGGVVRPPGNRRGAAEECLIARAPYHGATAWTRRTDRRLLRVPLSAMGDTRQNARATAGHWPASTRHRMLTVRRHHPLGCDGVLDHGVVALTMKA